MKKKISNKRKINIKKILAKVNVLCDLCDYATENLCIEDAHFEELDFLLRDIIR